ncbi:MAG: SAM-dependent methyltransferase [Phycisphaerales bacterium]|nr:SAM-dependent methyltransferase [Phycisphaerales bacterium]
MSQHERLGIEVPEGLASYTAEITRCRELSGALLGPSLARRLLLLKAGVMQSCAIPGIYLHHVLRKRYIESLAREALGTTMTQMVVIGAGFDTLSLRLSVDCPGHTIIEIDHPATQKVKRALLEDFQLPAGSGQFLPADLASETLASALARCTPYDPDQPTLFIVEGLTMYLEESTVRDLLACIGDQARGSAVLFTYMEESSPGCYDFQNARRVTSWWLALRHERFTWGLKPADLPDFLSESGFSLQAHRTPEELRLELLTEPNRHAKLTSGENTALASAST